MLQRAKLKSLLSLFGRDNERASKITVGTCVGLAKTNHQGM